MPGTNPAVHQQCFSVQSLQQPTQAGVTLPGYSLQLPMLSDSADLSLTPSLLEGVGLEPRYHPSHLELMQVVEQAALPLEWLSPLQCSLYPSVPYRTCIFTLSCYFL